MSRSLTDANAETHPTEDDLRQRIRRALCEFDGQGALWGTDLLEPDEYGEQADAVLAALREGAA